MPHSLILKQHLASGIQIEILPLYCNFDIETNLKAKVITHVSVNMHKTSNVVVPPVDNV